VTWIKRTAIPDQKAEVCDRHHVIFSIYGDATLSSRLPINFRSGPTQNIISADMAAIPPSTWLLWFFSILSIFILSLGLILRLPSPQNDVFRHLYPDILPVPSTPPPRRTPHPQCCIATLFDNISIAQTVALGHSLKSSLLAFRPRVFAIATSDIASNSLSVIQQYFTVVNATKTLSLGEFPEFHFWATLTGGHPVVGVSHTGLFNRAQDSLCQAEPFSAVARLGDVVYFDPSMMLLDPTKRLAKSPDALNFAKLINQEFANWNILPSDSSVADLENEYLDFWLPYGSPTYWHFEEEMFRRAVKKSKKTLGSPALFEIMTRIIDRAVPDHPAAF
jgi:hypothetical protein